MPYPCGVSRGGTFPKWILSIALRFYLEERATRKPFTFLTCSLKLHTASYIIRIL